MNRLFGEFISDDEYDNFEKADGKYDIVFTHRDSMNKDGLNTFRNHLTKDTKIICDITTESGNIQCFLDEFLTLTKNNDYKFYLVVDSDLTEYINKVDLPYKILHSFELVFYAFLNPKGDNQMKLGEEETFGNENTFMSLNNSCRPHRIYLLSEFVKRNLSFDNCSFLFTTGGNGGYKYNEKVFKETLINLSDDGIISKDICSKILKMKLPITIDHDVSEKPEYISNKINKLYNPILNLVTENLTGMDHGDVSPYGIITFTEKTIKPFQAKQIPLFIGLCGLQDVYRKLGFDLFDDLINNDFENEQNPIKRISMVVDELERLSKIDLVDFKNKNLHRFEKNYNLLNLLSKKGKSLVSEFLYKEVL